MGESWSCKHPSRHAVSAGLVDAIHWRQLLLRADLWQKESHICVSSEPLTAKTPREHLPPLLQESRLWAANPRKTAFQEVERWD